MYPMSGYLEYGGTWGYVWSGSVDYAEPPLVLYLFFGGDQTVSSANFSRYNAFLVWCRWIRGENGDA